MLGFRSFAFAFAVCTYSDLRFIRNRNQNHRSNLIKGVNLDSRSTEPFLVSTQCQEQNHPSTVSSSPAPYSSVIQGRLGWLTVQYLGIMGAFCEFLPCCVHCLWKGVVIFLVIYGWIRDR